MEVFVSGLSLVGKGIRSINSGISEIIDSADYSIQIAVYFVTAGADPILNLLTEKLDAGVEVTFIVNNLSELNENVCETLQDLDETYDSFKLIDFSEEGKEGKLHAKVITADREKALVGSANLTWKGRISNHEIAVAVDGEEASRIASAVDRLT